jgi:hypothetical protein
MKTKIILFISILGLFSSSIVAQKVTSSFSNLNLKLCQTLASDSNKGGSYKGKCPGIAGYSLEIVEDMNRNLNILDSSGKTYELKIGYFSKLFSDFGPKAEWRMKGKTPIALIVRLKVTDQYDYRQKYSYLVIAKITKDEICTTDVVNLNKTPNANAQKMADAAPTKPCRATE